MWGNRLHNPYRLGGHQSGIETSGGYLTHAGKCASELLSYGKPRKFLTVGKQSKDAYIAPAGKWAIQVLMFGGVPNWRQNDKWLHNPFHLGGPQMSNWAKQPLPSWVCI